MGGVLVLAAPTIGAGGLGFLVILALIVAVVFLFRSMNTHLKRVPKSFDEPAEPPATAAPADRAPHQP